MDDVRVRAGVYCRNITISTNATASIKRVPARKVTPQTLAKRPECTLMSGMTKSPSTCLMKIPAFVRNKSHRQAF
jgi:hypothetical protein